MENEGGFFKSVNPLKVFGGLDRIRKYVIDLINPPDNKVVPVNVRICSMCFEGDATKRKCCNDVFCDHCYTKNKCCPHCGTSTRLEKMTGATFALGAFSEHEECRVCLEPGTKRRCCGNYYCDECYYKVPICRSCEAPVGRKPTAGDKLKSTLLTAIISWMSTVMFILIVVAFGIIMSYNETQTKIMMSGYKCYGLFKDCTVDICAEVDPRAATGEIALPPLSSWKPCTDSSLVKIESKACIFDPQLYYSTKSVMGYDLCMEKFPQGVFIWEDTFESWGNYSLSSNHMASAKWAKIQNGFSTPYCGAAEHLGGNRALTFSGDPDRFAITTDVDISSGGWIEAELFIAPIGFDVGHPFCKSAYRGIVDVQYSIDHGTTWVTMQSYDAGTYRSEKFFYIRQMVPPGSQGATSSTRFRFKQRDFFSARDGWAIDNVRILRYLPTDWYIIAAFKANVEFAKIWIQKAQCCFDTDWCQTRLTEGQMDHCSTYFQWYNGRIYLLRGAELYVTIIVLVNLLKFAYVSVYEWIVKKRFPFQDEYEDVAKMDRIMKYIPARYRPKKSLESYVSNIHMSARLAAELRNAFDDEAGEGGLIKTKEEAEMEKKKEEERLRKEKKKLKKRMKSKHFQGSQIDVVATSEEEVDEAKEENHMVKFGTEKISDEMDVFKKSNVGMLRVPFETKVNKQWCNTFRNIVLSVYIILIFIKLSTTSYYIVHNPVTAYGAIHGDMSVTSQGVFFLAAVCDFKEIFYTLKYVVPARDEWVPYITIDLTEELNALFIGKYSISLKDVSEINAFSTSFALGCAISYVIGCFPYCLFSIILRDQFLAFTSMRIVTPIFGIIMLTRAILGPSFILKIIFSFNYLFTTDMKTREKTGVAFQTLRTRSSAVVTMFSVGFGAAFVCAAIYLPLASIALGLGLFIGLIYGAYTGCIHSLPIRPWMVLTCIREGVWIRVKKQQRCPCIYWGAFCTDMHDADEMFVVFTDDMVKFVNYIKGGVAQAAS